MPRTRISIFAATLLAFVLSIQMSLAQVSLLKIPQLDGTEGSISPALPNNSVSHMTKNNTSLWIGTSKGVARSNNAGATWESFRSVPQFASRGIFGISVRANSVWASTGFTKTVDGSSIQTGSGYAYSLDNGSSWTQVPQPLDGIGDSIVTYGSNTVKFLPIVVPEQNVTFDIAQSSQHIWIASWSSGIRKSSNNGQTWERIVLPSDTRNSIAPTDSLVNYSIDPRRNNNFLGFAVYVENDTTIWAGTAGGVNRSTDGGRSWAKFTTLNQASPILGNWVIAISGQKIGSISRIWTTNWRADLDPKETQGVSYTDDGGRIWKNFLHGVKAYDFAFKDSITYIATEAGIYRTSDNGRSWTTSGTIIDNSSAQQITSQSFFSIEVIGDTVFCGGSEGLVKTIDNDTHPFGKTWTILRAYQPVGKTNTTYSYPNPFSPSQERVRFHYGTGGKDASVTVEIFDFGMNRVKTVIKDAQRSGAMEHDEIWDGRNDFGVQVANGVYFYRVTIDGAEPSWGKVMVIQ